ncbi:MAG: glycosyltransferase [Casimicrobiaceae bacterium]
MIGVVVPAHDEEALIGACVESLRIAAGHAQLDGEDVDVVVVLDDCNDATARIVARSGFASLVSRARNVGVARALGARHLLDKGARWLAFTDADTRVAPDWLARQLALCADAVCGSIGVDWPAAAGALRERHDRDYTDADGHRHVHGANLGVCAKAYLRAGGFAPLAVSEDVALVDALLRSGAKVAWSAAPRVITSARLKPRARGGFGDYLRRLAQASAIGAQAA